MALVILWAGKDSVGKYWFHHGIQSWIFDADNKDSKNIGAWYRMVSTLHLGKDTNMQWSVLSAKHWNWISEQSIFAP